MSMPSRDSRDTGSGQSAVTAMHEATVAQGVRRRRGARAFFVLGALALAVIATIGIYAFMTAGEESTDDAVVAKVLVHDNQMVAKGDLLLELDPADFAARLDQATADLNTARAQAAGADAQVQVVQASATGGLRSAKAQVAASSSAVESADAEVAAARAALARAQAEVVKTVRDLERAKELIATDAIARQQLDAAQLASDAAKAAASQAQANLARAEQMKRAAESRVQEAEGRLSQTTPVDAQITAAHAAAELARARVAAAEAPVNLARQQLTDTRLLAPNAGFVTQLSAREGSLVMSGQPLAQLVPDETYVVANFKETQIKEMRPGDRAEIDIDAYPGHPLEGVVESMAGGTGARFSLLPPDNASGNFVKVVQRVPVRLAWTTPPDVPLKVGLSARVIVHAGEASK
jgi:membrane fusion protein (multidrug efflux system)